MKTTDSTNGQSEQLITSDEIQDILAIARHAAAYGLGHGRMDEAEDIAHEIKKKVLELTPLWAKKAGSKPINLKGWAYQSALNLARKRGKKESHNVSLDLDYSENLLAALELTLPTADSADVLLDYKEVSEALPELVELLHGKVLLQLDPLDVRIMHLFHYDHLSFKQMSQLLGLSLSNTKQRYYRSLHFLQGALLDALQTWGKGKELFFDALLSPDNLAGLFALCRIRDTEGLDALKSAVETTLSRSKLPQGRAVHGKRKELLIEQQIQRLVGEVVTGLKTLEGALDNCRGLENQFHLLLQSRILEILSPTDLNAGERGRLEALYRQSRDEQHELGD